MGTLNKVILIGRLGKDPEVRAIPGGAKVANFSIATSETWKDKDENKQEKTEWHNIVLWRGLAEVAEKYLNKGDLVCIEGKLQTRKWEDVNGQTRYSTEIIGDSMTMLGSSKGAKPEAESGFIPADTAEKSPAEKGMAPAPDAGKKGSTAKATTRR